MRFTPRERVGDATLLWHADRDLKGVDAVVVPGGFSYGDYLRAGAIARFAPVMEEVAEFARDGRARARDLQRLSGSVRGGAPPGGAAPEHEPEVHLPPGRARGRRRRHRRSRARVRNGERLSIPVKHTTGRYYSPDPVHVVLRYAPGENPNGSQDDIAGVCNDAGNVFGLMPHPSTRSTR